MDDNKRRMFNIQIQNVYGVLKKFRIPHVAVGSPANSIMRKVLEKEVIQPQLECRTVGWETNGNIRATSGSMRN
jgi:hypothetical protein